MTTQTKLIILPILAISYVLSLISGCTTTSSNKTGHPNLISLLLPKAQTDNTASNSKELINQVFIKANFGECSEHDERRYNIEAVEIYTTRGLERPYPPTNSIGLGQPTYILTKGNITSDTITVKIVDNDNNIQVEKLKLTKHHDGYGGYLSYHAEFACQSTPQSIAREKQRQIELEEREIIKAKQQEKLSQACKMSDSELRNILWNGLIDGLKKDGINYDRLPYQDKEEYSEAIDESLVVLKRRLAIECD